MTEWGVFLVIVAVAGFLVTIITPISKLTQSITKLTVVVDKLCKDMDSHKKHSIESHDKLWAHNDKQDAQIHDHETRLRLLEAPED